MTSPERFAWGRKEIPMKSFTSVLTLFSFVVVQFCTPFAGQQTIAQTASTANTANQSPFLSYQGLQHNLPPNAVIGSTPERRAAYNSLTAQERQALIDKVKPRMSAALQTAQQDYDAAVANQNTRVSNIGTEVQHSKAPIVPVETSMAFVSEAGQESTITATPPSSVAKAGWPELEPLLRNTQASPASFKPASFRLTSSNVALDDKDGLSQAFEIQLADSFTPFYHVSGGEPDSFASFFNSVPTTVQQRFGPHPLSYNRVKPLGFVKNSKGVQFGVVRIDYLTLWDQDTGLSLSGSCQTEVGIAGGIVGLGLLQLFGVVLNGHNLDDEHSAALVVAPTAALNTFNLNASAYSAISYYTAAHEFTFADHSEFLFPSSPVPAGLHLQLFLSRSKHSTYPFNPSGLPITPSFIINAYFATIDALHFEGFIDDFQFLFYLFVGDTAFFSCVIEQFADIGGAFASPRIDVGEPIVGQVENSAGFILDSNHVLPKLQAAYWSIVNGGIVVGKARPPRGNNGRPIQTSTTTGSLHVSLAGN
jgi:hypothetical protein